MREREQEGRKGGRVLRWFAVAVVGAIVCTVCDHLHVVYGVLAYAHPDVWRQAWWVPLLFAVAAVAMVGGVPLFRDRLGGQKAPLDVSALVRASVAFVAAYALTAVDHASPNLVLGVLVGSWLWRVSAGAPRWIVLYALATAVVGPLMESAISRAGAFHYLAPDFLGVARWLPALYLHAGLVAEPVRRWVDR